MKFKAIQSERLHEPTMEPEITFFTGHDEAYTVGAQGVMECDGTHYEILAIPVGKNFGNRGMGGFDAPAYIVIAFPFNKAYLMSPTNWIMEGYVHEKLIPRGSTVDAENIAFLWEQVRKEANIRYGFGEPSNVYVIE